MTVIGLTGGIASGKSTAAEMLREFGATVIDADRLGHRSYEPGTPGFEKVVNAFGHDVVGKDGVIDRRVLGGKVFGAPEQLERLNSIVWPEIRTLIQEEIHQVRSQDPETVIVVEAAVLLEAGWEDLCDQIWVVLTPVKTAVERLRSRNGLSEDAAMARIESQMSNKERSDRAAVKIENAGTEEQLRQRMEKAWATLEASLGRKSTRPQAPSEAAGPSAKPAAPKRAKQPAAAAKAAPKTTTRAAGKASSKAASKPATKAKAAAKPAPKTKPAAASKAKPAAKAATASKAAPKAAKPASGKAATSKAASAKSKPAKPAPKAAAARKPAASTRTVAKRAPAVKTSGASTSRSRSGSRSK